MSTTLAIILPIHIINKCMLMAPGMVITRENRLPQQMKQPDGGVDAPHPTTLTNDEAQSKIKPKDSKPNAIPSSALKEKKASAAPKKRGRPPKEPRL